MVLIHYVVCSDFGEGKKGVVKAAAWLKKKYNIKQRSRYFRKEFRDGKPTVCYVSVRNDGSATITSHEYVTEESLSWINLCKRSILGHIRYVRLYKDLTILGEL